MYRENITKQIESCKYLKPLHFLAFKHLRLSHEATIMMSGKFGLAKVEDLSL